MSFLVTKTKKKLSSINSALYNIYIYTYTYMLYICIDICKIYDMHKIFIKEGFITLNDIVKIVI